jgi:hypothetical protein
VDKNNCDSIKANKKKAAGRGCGKSALEGDPKKYVQGMPEHRLMD